MRSIESRKSWSIGLAILASIGLGPCCLAWPQETSGARFMSRSSRLYFQRIPLTSRTLLLRLDHLTDEDLIVLRSKGRDLVIVGGLYQGKPLPQGMQTQRTTLEEVVSADFAPLPEQSVEVEGAQVTVQRPSAVSGIVFLDITVPEGIWVNLTVNGRSIFSAPVTLPLSLSQGKLGLGTNGVAQTMSRVQFPPMSDVIPHSTPGEYVVAFHRLKIRKRITPSVAPGENLRVFLMIDETGRVIRTFAFGADGRRNTPAEAQIQEWEFEPFTLNGRPVRVYTVFTIR